MKCLVLWQFSLYVVLGFFAIVTCPVHAATGTTIDGNSDKEHSYTKFNETSHLPTNSVNIHDSAMETIYVPTSPLGINQPSPNQQHSNLTNSDEDSLEEQLKDDQVALRRMVLILSLVGGLGALAVITTIVIFTKMRRRKKRRVTNKFNSTSTHQHHHNKPANDMYTHRQRHHNHHQQQHRNSNDSNSNNNNNNNERMTSNWNEVPSSTHCNITPINTIAITSSSQPPLITPQPSAPPPSSQTVQPPTITIPPNHYRQVITMSSQQQQQQQSITTTPEPSAPSAKELENSSNMNNRIPATNSCTLYDPEQHHHQDPSYPGTTVVEMTPELPPPAYTPSPPLYQGDHPPGPYSQQHYHQQLARRHSQS